MLASAVTAKVFSIVAELFTVVHSFHFLNISHCIVYERASTISLLAATSIIFIRFLQNVLDSIEKLSHFSMQFRFDLKDIYLAELFIPFGINAIAHINLRWLCLLTIRSQKYTHAQCRTFSFCRNNTTTHKASQLAVETRTTIN